MGSLKTGISLLLKWEGGKELRRPFSVLFPGTESVSSGGKGLSCLAWGNGNRHDIKDREPLRVVSCSVGT